MIEEVKKKKPKKPNRFYRFLVFLLTVGLVAGAVGLVANRDKLNIDSIRRFFSYRATTQSSVGSTDPFPYQGGATASFASVGGDLLSASVSGFRLYSPGGKAYIEETLILTHPALSVTGNAAVAYDAGGTELRVYRDHGEVFSLTSTDGAILSASLNSNHWLAVVTRATGFKGVVTIYNSKWERVMAFRVSSSYLLGAAISSDQRRVTVLTAGQNGHSFESSLVNYSMDTAAVNGATELVPEATFSLSNRVPLSLRWQGNTLLTLTEYGLFAVDAQLRPLGEYDFSDRHLKQFSLNGDDFSALLLGKYRAGSQAELMTVDASGTILGSLETTEQILSLSAAGRYLAVLTADRLDIYTKDLTPYATLEGTHAARQAVVRADGTVLLVSSDSAWLYIPS